MLSGSLVLDRCRVKLWGQWFGDWALLCHIIGSYVFINWSPLNLPALLHPWESFLKGFLWMFSVDFLSQCLQNQIIFSQYDLTLLATWNNWEGCGKKGISCIKSRTKEGKWLGLVTNCQKVLNWLAQTLTVRKVIHLLWGWVLSAFCCDLRFFLQE